MSWQDELRRLDAALAEGRITLHEHRRQREELLAAASGGLTPSPVAAPLAGPQSVNPAHRPPPQPEPKPSASAALLASDRPTSAPSPADQRATERMPYPPITETPTVVTRAIGPLPGLVPPRRPTVPPLPTVPVRKPAKKPTWLFVTVGVVLVLAMIIAATVLLKASDDTTGTAAPAQVAPADALEMAAAKVPTLPGAANPGNATMPLDQAVGLQLISQADANLMKSAGASQVIFRGSNDPANSPNGDMLLVVPASSKAAADQLTVGMRKELTAGGFTMSALGQAQSDLAFTASSPAGRVMALWYASGTLAVGMGVSQPLTGDPAQLRTRLDQIRKQVTSAFPAG
ncbi:MAG TPA: hypothetical protein VJ870_06810 [Amycolatopsis sp.]|nr:hypothetical protein [Amycolatopsis sp.]